MVCSELVGLFDVLRVAVMVVVNWLEEWGGVFGGSAVRLNFAGYCYGMLGFVI